MSGPFILLDTCAALWTATDEMALSEDAAATIAEAERNGGSILISPITAWEVGLLVSRGRLALATSPLRWFEGLLDAGLILAPLTPEILIHSSFLPGGVLRDPADRTLATTARTMGCRLMTRDRILLDYAREGHLQAVPC